MCTSASLCSVIMPFFQHWSLGLAGYVRTLVNLVALGLRVWGTMTAVNRVFCFMVDTDHVAAFTSFQVLQTNADMRLTPCDSQMCTVLPENTRSASLEYGSPLAPVTEVLPATRLRQASMLFGRYPFPLLIVLEAPEAFLRHWADRI